MGKKGDLLRAQKAQRVTYTFTAEQLQEHDRQVRDAYKKQADQHMRKLWDEYDRKQREEFDAHIHELWNERMKEFNEGMPEDKITVMLSYLLSISARVLIEQFGWTPVEGHRYTRRNRIVRFSNAVVDEIMKITANKMIGIQEYTAETYRLYGVRFLAEDDT